MRTHPSATSGNCTMAESTTTYEQARQLLRQRLPKHTALEVEFAEPLPRLPQAPTSIEETGLRQSFLLELTLKTLFFRGQISGSEICAALRLPYPRVVENVLRFGKDDGLIEIKGGTDYQETNWEFALTQKGMTRARDIFEREGYVGPAPVPLAEYSRALREQPVRWNRITEEKMRQAVGDMVINDETIDQLGPAFNSGKSMFLYGSAGNGKTLVSERMGRSLGGGLLVPFALEVYGQVIQLFDATYHEGLFDASQEDTGSSSEEKYDHRWALCKRPFIVVGGELTLAHLSLRYDPDAKYYVAPLQMKANGGVFMVDDFGRQQVSARDLLNRWVVPLEKNVDYHNLVSGQQVQVPFEVFIIFSTNLAPKDLVEEAFLRRIRYKVGMPDPTEEEFRRIFCQCCHTFGIEFRQDSLDYLIERHYREAGRRFRAVHPRDLLSQIIDISNYTGEKPRLEKSLIDTAVKTYFVEL